MATITIKQRQLHDSDPAEAAVDADIFGVFAVHRVPGWFADDEPEFTLTHVPSGYAFLSGVSKENAEACARDLNAGDIDWSIITKPSDMTPAHKAQGKLLRARYER